MSELIKSAAQLAEIKKEFLKNQEQYKRQILICGGAGCVSSNCAAIENAVKEELKIQGIDKDIKVHQTGCMGICALGPTMLVLPERIFYVKLNPDKTKEIVQSHLVNNSPIEKYTFFDKSAARYIPKIDDIEFFKAQVKIVLDLCGIIDYSDIRDYIAHDGYSAAAKAITGMSQEEVIKEVETSGLRGRGGAGFPTGTKIRAGFSQKSDIKYLVCNADEGDPGAFMDRSVIEGDPHCVIEGMMIEAYAIGAQQGYVYIRAEYPIAVERLQIALEQARKCGILGQNIFGTNYNFDIEIRIGAGAFVCGEETALIASIEGKRGEPKQKPPFPFQKGLFGYPTIINNVETLANIPKIIRNGGSWYASFGTEKARGTKVFALAGDVENTGIIEVPMGTTIGDIVYNIGGGIPHGKEFKAAQIGGPSGGCVTKENLNVPTDYESLNKIGAIMGSGGLIVMNNDTCMVDTARYFMDFIRDESCGKCVACRVGTKRMLEILENITQGKGKPGDIDLLIELGETIQISSMCGLGQSAPNPVLSTIRFFRKEFEEHIHNKHCSAGVCADMYSAPCQNACPADINVAGYVHLIAAGRPKDAYDLIMQENPFPAVCGRVCTHPCERKCRRGTVDQSIAIRELKRFASDYAFKNEVPYKLQPAAKKGKRIAIIGAGPSGLTCGYYLANLGYNIDVFESQSTAGGVLLYGIPEYRLPKNVLAHEIGIIEHAGVNIHLNQKITKDKFKKLREDYDAIYVAIGAQKASRLNIEGEDLTGVIHGLDFLQESYFKPGSKLHGTVAVIGGGNTAVDAARTALRLGAEKVQIVYRRTQDAMPAFMEEIEEALEEGIEVLELTAPVKFIGKDGKIVGIECVKMKLGTFDYSGRRKSVEIKGSNFILPVDYAIAAVSQIIDLEFITKEEVELDKWNCFVVNPDTQATSLHGVFAGGDIARGPDDAIHAIADGKNAAVAIDAYLGGKGILNKGDAIEIPDIYDGDEVIAHPQFGRNVLPAEVRKNNFDEVGLGFHKINAIAEAMRCLHCERR